MDATALVRNLRARGVPIIAAVMIVPAIVFVTSFVASQQSSIDADISARLTVVRPESVRLQRSTPATLNVTYDVPAELVAPQWSGLVTGVFIDSDHVVASGDIVLSVDSVDRIAWNSTEPFYRHLALKANGADVQELRTFLTMFEFLSADEAVGDTFDPAMQSAVAAFAASIGSKGTTFDPAWIVWLPSAEFSPATVTAKVGTQATPGEIIAPAEPQIASAWLSGPDGETLVFDFSTSTTMKIADSAVPIAVSSDHLNDDEIDLLTSIALIQPPDERDATTVPPESSTRSLGVEVEVTLVSTTAIDVSQLAVGSIYTDPAGLTCVFAKTGGTNGQEFDPIIVAPLPDSPGPGLAYVAPPLEADVELLAKPAAWAGHRSCN